MKLQCSIGGIKKGINKTTVQEIHRNKGRMEIKTKYCQGCFFVGGSKGLATNLTCLCLHEKTLHHFALGETKIKDCVAKRYLHVNAKVFMYAINYQLVDAIQAIGNGPHDSISLLGFLDIPSTNNISRKMRFIERKLGKLQDFCDEIQNNAVKEVIALTAEKEDGLKLHESI